MTTQSSPVSLAAQEDPRVQAAMQHITEGVEELYRALAALGAETPRLSGVLAKAVAPGLCVQAIEQVRERFLTA